MKNPILIIFCLTFYISQSIACDILGESGFMPKNSLRITTSAKEKNSMTKEAFESIINRVYEAYSPIVLSMGATLKMNNDWEDATVNAYANQVGKTWNVHMFGGLARHPLVTDDGFMLVVCHETGHHLGGAPKYGGGNDWAANEGQADYFGALKCMKRVLEKDDNQAIISKMTVDEEAKLKCEMAYKTGDDIALCERIAMAGKSLALLLGELGGNKNIAFETPDMTIVKRTYDYHPKAQCRMDTYFQASLCDKPFSEDVSSTNPIQGTCIKRDGYLLGTRPLCWYKPGNEEI